MLASVLGGCGKGTTPSTKNEPANTDPAKIEQSALTLVVGSVAPDSGNIYNGEIRVRHGAQLRIRIGGKIIERLGSGRGRCWRGSIPRTPACRRARRRRNTNWPSWMMNI